MKSEELRVMSGIKFKYRTDDEMKDSGVEWIGKIPLAWSVKRNKNLYEINKKLVGNKSSVYKVLSLTLRGVIERDFTDNAGKIPASFDGYQIIDKNSILLCLFDMDVTPRISGYVPQKGIVSPAYTNINATNEQVNNKFYSYWFLRMDFEKILLSQSKSLRNTLTNDNFLNLPIISLESKEQEKIVKFLDEKTSEFDSIISKKEALIQKLEEAKKSLISEVVTGKVKVVKTNDGYELVERKKEEMKDSGVEWLGDIPKGWKYGQLKYLCRYITDGAHISPDLEAGIYPFLSVKDLKKGKLDFENCLLTSRINYEYLKKNSCNPKMGDVLISKDGTIGKTTTINYNKDFVVASSLVILTPIKELESRYFEYSLNSVVCQEQINSFVKGAALPRISISLLKEIYIPFTRDLLEQRLIVTYLDIEFDRLERIVYKTKEQIEKLKEAKQSLISEAVTGKIEILD